MSGDILIVAEHLEGRLAPSTFEVVSLGRALAAASGGVVRVALFGQGVRALAEALAKLGVEVLLVEDVALAEYTGDGYVLAVRGLLESAKPRLLLAAHTAQGYDLAPGLAGALDLPLVTNAVGVRLDGSRLVVTRRLLNEKVQAEIEIASDRMIVGTVRPGSVKAASPAPGGIVVPTKVSIEASRVRMRFARIERPTVQDIDLAAADVIVSGVAGSRRRRTCRSSRSSRRPWAASSAHHVRSPTWTGSRRRGRSVRAARRSTLNSTWPAGSAARCSTSPA